MKRWLGILFFVTGLMFGASQVLAQNIPLEIPVDTQALKIVTNSGVKSFALEIADTNEKRSRGLMYRTDFPADRAMIFVFETVQPVMMWMANTPLPLDMLFVSTDGKIAHIAENTKPFSQDIVSSGVPVAFVLELNAGTVAKLGIKAGDHVQHPIICGSCK